MATSKIEGDDNVTRADDADTRTFIETHNVTKVARKAAPGAGEESADLLQTDEVDRPDGSAGKASESR